MLMRSFFIIITYLFIFSPLIFGTVVNVSAPAYKNQVIIWKKKIDYISNQYEMIDKKRLDSNGFATLNFQAKQIELTEIHIGRSHAMLYLDTARNQYNIYFPKDTLLEKASFKKSQIQILFIDLEYDDINNLILDFNLQLDYFLYGDTTKLIRMAKHNKKFQDSLNEFKISLTKRYENYPIKFLHNYIRYEIALLEQLAHQSKGEYYKNYLYETYLKKNEINYKNDSYMQFFNIFYSDVFSIGNVTFNEKVKFSINNYGDLNKLIEVTKESRFFSNSKVSELALIKGLYDSYSSNEYNSTIILEFLSKISNSTNWKTHKLIAQNCISELKKFSIGTRCPNFIFIDNFKNEISINKLKGKYTYINFFASWNNISLHEMEILKQFSKKYDFINFLSVNLDFNINDFQEFIENNEFKTWPICYPKDKEELISFWELDHLPTHLLIDPDGLISQFPALPPTNSYNNNSIDETFFNIQKKLSPKKSYQIGSKY